MDENSRLVPLVKLGDREYLVDIDNREIVDAQARSRCIDMHSARGRKLLDEMPGQEWRCFAVYSRKEDKLEV
jgi:hypothetical protein